MDEAKEKRDTEIDSLNRELSEYIQQMAELNETSTPNYGKTIEQLSERQRLRRITELKGRADLALCFLESHGLKLTCLKVRESDSRREHTFDFRKGDSHPRGLREFRTAFIFVGQILCQ